jgi:hypothetical protein
MATKGLPLLEPLSWIAFATTSLPVPVSPWINTAQSSGAIMLMSSITLQNALLAPIKLREIMVLSFLAALQTIGTVLGSCDCSVNGAQEFFTVEWFIENRKRPRFEGPFTRHVILPRGDKDDWETGKIGECEPLQLPAVDLCHADISDRAAGDFKIVGLEYLSA